ncbi:MAG: hypothetical protein ACOC54_04290, partial [Candidatus Sumerlaeota bacterium]
MRTFTDTQKIKIPYFFAIEKHTFVNTSKPKPHNYSKVFLLSLSSQFSSFFGHGEEGGSKGAGVLAI